MSRIKVETPVLGRGDLGRSDFMKYLLFPSNREDEYRVAFLHGDVVEGDRETLIEILDELDYSPYSRASRA